MSTQPSGAAAPADTIDTYTPIRWAVLSEDEKYQEYIRAVQRQTTGVTIMSEHIDQIAEYILALHRGDEARANELRKEYANDEIVSRRFRGADRLMENRELVCEILDELENPDHSAGSETKNHEVSKTKAD